MILDGLGFIPVVGIAIDVVHGALYYAEGNVVDGAFTMAAAIPIVGDAAKAARLGYKGGKAVYKVAKSSNKAIEAGKFVGKNVSFSYKGAKGGKQALRAKIKVKAGNPRKVAVRSLKKATLKYYKWAKKNRPKDILTFIKHRKIYENPKYFDQKTGNPLYPDDGGFASSDAKTLKKGFKLDRYGGSDGSFFAKLGTAFEKRSLPPHHKAERKLHKYEVLKPFEVEAGPAKPWFGQKGGGMQYRAKINGAVVSLEKLREYAKITDRMLR